MARRLGYRLRPRPGSPPRRTRVSRPGPNSMSSVGGLSSISAIASSIRSARIRASRRSRRSATSSLGRRGRPCPFALIASKCGNSAARPQESTSQQRLVLRAPSPATVQPSVLPLMVPPDPPCLEWKWRHNHCSCCLAAGVPMATCSVGSCRAYRRVATDVVGKGGPGGV